MTKVRMVLALALCCVIGFGGVVEGQNLRLKRSLKKRPTGKQKSKLKRELKEIGDLALSAQKSQTFVVKALPRDALVKIAELAKVDFNKGGELDAAFKNRRFRSNKSRKKMINAILAARSVIVRVGEPGPPPVPRPTNQSSSAFAQVLRVTPLAQSGVVRQRQRQRPVDGTIYSPAESPIVKPNRFFQLPPPRQRIFQLPSRPPVNYEQLPPSPQGN